MAQLMATFEFLERSDVGVLHGDVKPDNIIITTDEEARLIDFGLSYRNGSMQVCVCVYVFIYVCVCVCVYKKDRDCVECVAKINIP